MAAGHSKTIMRLARRHGIEPRYTDELGRTKTVSPENLSVILHLLGIPIPDTIGRRPAYGDAADEAAQWQSFAPPTIVVRSNAQPRVWHIHLPVGKQTSTDRPDIRLHWTLRDESGAASEYGASPGEWVVEATRMIGKQRYVRLALPFPQGLPSGYYRIDLRAEADRRHQEATTRLIVVPDRCYLPSGWEPGRRATSRRQAGGKWWGLTVQLYGLRSRRNWGIGDFRDLASLMRWAGRLGAAMVGVNPLHALPPGGISPYSPTSRLFHNPLYLDLKSIEEYKHPTIQSVIQGRTFQRRLSALRRSETVDYEAVQRLKWPLLRKFYRIFTETHLGHHTRRGAAFEQFVKEQGEYLERFALFQALQEHVTKRGAPSSWREWPAEYRHPGLPAVKRFLRRYRTQVDFYRYLEWQCDVQLGRVQSTARRAGMPIGLYTDFAIGIDPNGADAWMFQEDFAQGASVGAPPDLFSPKGQNWGLAPPHPNGIVQTGYRLFVEGFRRNMRHSGLFRLDHAMGLFRLFWVPDGRPAADGAYVTYPRQDLLGILALESRRHRVIVVGEDLGTVTQEIRTQLMQAGLLSYRLLLFEKSADGTFLPFDRYPAQAMTAVTTHDLPTLRGFWSGRDIDLKEKLGLYPDASLIESDKEARRCDRQALLTTLRRARLLPKDNAKGSTQPAATALELDETLCRAVYTFLARTPSHLLAVPLEDLLGDRETPNLPGAPGDAYPIWRIKTGPSGSTMETWSRLRTVRMLASVLRQERPVKQRRDTRKQLASSR